jgi:hypothetical protein
MKTIEPQEQGDLDGFDTSAGVMAFIYAQCGVIGLRELLAMINCAQEDLLRDAEELQAVGLPVVEAIVREVAAAAPPERVSRCPYDEADAANYQSWQASYDRRLLSQAGKIAPPRKPYDPTGSGLAW